MWEGRQVAVDWWQATLGDDVHYVQNVGFGSPLVIHCFVYSLLFSLPRPQKGGKRESRSSCGSMYYTLYTFLVLSFFFSCS